MCVCVCVCALFKCDFLSHNTNVFLTILFILSPQIYEENKSKLWQLSVLFI